MAQKVIIGNVRGPKGDKGAAGAMFSFAVEEDDLVVYHTEEGEAPNFYINEDGELIIDIDV